MSLQYSPKMKFLIRRQISLEDLKELCTLKTPCYLNIDSYTEIGEKFYQTLVKTMPLPLDQKFCIIGYVRNRDEDYHFVIPKKLLFQHYKYDLMKEKYTLISKVEMSLRKHVISCKNRGYNLTSANVARIVLSKLPFKNFIPINHPSLTLLMSKEKLQEYKRRRGYDSEPKRRTMSMKIDMRKCLFRKKKIEKEKRRGKSFKVKRRPKSTRFSRIYDREESDKESEGKLVVVSRKLFE